MYLIGSIFVSEEVADEQFACNLTACKGACCWEGEFGAPLADEELEDLKRVYPEVAPLMTEAGRRAVAEQGLYTRNSEMGEYATTLVNGGPCAYMMLDEGGVAQCTIERAYREGKTDWKKPISCHLYPIRVTEKKEANFTALNYDRWDICSAACTKGQKEKIRVFEFAREALIRKYGKDWYEELAAAVDAKAD
ncbi:DUF3109 family protein [Lewinella sp. W8]|uniref:DUF3109 family protein n=1 Tax=Lewinella sp. W8 TaxID=2528208 RepID=UPI0010689DDC|nr:DUF3109 family protein [Lewinella sp. W8]MTB49696.1 DUF3109 family protein [Lewinella sp. W8]